jgi:DNA polymerase I-like protein with 3'-5' exonuclease and polymerase domains
MHKPQMVVIDFETFYSKEIGFSKQTTEQYIRDPQFQIIGCAVKRGDEETVWMSFDSFIEYKKALAPYIEGNIIVAHNAMFDVAILAWRLGLNPAFIIDTLSMARPHFGTHVGGSLKALAQHFELGVKGTEVESALGKRLEDFTPEQLALYGEYCKNDVELTYKLVKRLYKMTPPQELKLIDLTLRMFVYPKLVLDEQILETHLNNVRADKQALMEQVEFGVGDVMSNNKFAEVLTNLGVSPPMKISARTGKETYAFGKTDKNFTALLEHPNPKVQAAVSARLGVKSSIEETRTEAFLSMARRGAMPVPLNYAGAVTTLRWSGADKVNLQNLPRGGNLRKAIKAPDGFVIVACDSSNIELRVNHTLAGQQETIEALRSGEDLYCQFASMLYDRHITKADKDERFIGKVAHLGLGYGMSWRKFKDTVRLLSKGKEISDEEAERIVNLWRSTYYMIPLLWKSADQLLAASATNNEYSIGFISAGDRMIHTPPKNQIYYPNLRMGDGGWVYDTKKFKNVEPVKVYGGKVVENICQHLARNIIAEQWIKIAERYPVVMQVHDEIVAIVPEAEAEEATKWMVEIMSTSPDWWPDIPLAAEASYGKSYGDAK